MTISTVLMTIFETLLVAFGLWALFNEDKFIAFEERLVASVKRRRLKVRTTRQSRVTGSKILRVTEFD